MRRHYQFCSILLVVCTFFASGPLLANEASSADSAIHAIQSIKDLPKRIDAYWDYISAIRQQQPKLAIEVANLMMNAAVQQRVDSNIFDSHTLLAELYFSINDYPNALKQYNLLQDGAEKAVSYKYQIEANLGIAAIYRTTGEVSKNPKDWDVGMVFVQKALAICRQHNVTRKEPKILNVMAIQYDLQKKHTEALKMFNDAIAAAHTLGDKRNEAIFFMNLGISLKNNKQLEESLAAYNMATILLDSIDMPMGKCAVTDNIANLYYEMNNPVQTEQNALKAIALSEQLSYDPVRVDMYELLVKHYRRQKQFEQALQYSSKLAVLKDSVFNTQKSQQLKELQTKYDTDIKDKTIDSQVAELAFNKKRSQYMWASIALLLGIAAVVFVSQRRTSQLNKKISLQSAELQQQKQELQQVNGIKDRLFSVISHDLRSPLNSLVSFTMLLDNGSIAPEKLHTYTAELKNNLGYTASLMENLLNFARSQMNGYTPNMEHFALADVVDDTAMLLQPIAHTKQLDLQININPAATVNADINMTALVLRNLISNAIKYSHKGGTITVSTAQLAGKTQLRVTDDGVGMDAELVAIFNKEENGQQLLSSTPGTQQEKGTGLGLLLCKNFAQLMQAKIWVESGTGRGCSFVVEFA